MSDVRPSAPTALGTWRWVLIGSLALNVLIVGAVLSTICIGHFGEGPDEPGGGRRGLRDSPLLGFARTLPHERADIIRQKVADAEPNLEARRQGIRRAFDGVHTALRAEPFEQAKLDAALDGVVEAETERARARTALFADAVRQLTPQERIELHEWLEKRRPHR